MSRFSGPQYKGAARSQRDLKRAQAKQRNESCPPERRRVHRIAVQAHEEAKSARAGRRQHIKQRQWINQARGDFPPDSKE